MAGYARSPGSRRRSMSRGNGRARTFPRTTSEGLPVLLIQPFQSINTRRPGHPDRFDLGRPDGSKRMWRVKGAGTNCCRRSRTPVPRSAAHRHPARQPPAGTGSPRPGPPPAADRLASHPRPSATRPVIRRPAGLVPRAPCAVRSGALGPARTGTPLVSRSTARSPAVRRPADPPASPATPGRSSGVPPGRSRGHPGRADPLGRGSPSTGRGAASGTGPVPSRAVRRGVGALCTARVEPSRRLNISSHENSMDRSGHILAPWHHGG